VSSSFERTVLKISTLRAEDAARQQRAGGLRKVGHAGKILAAQQPIVDLPGAKGGKAPAFDERLKFFKRKRQ
jgi:hypothetical protein